MRTTFIRRTTAGAVLAAIATAGIVSSGASAKPYDVPGGAVIKIVGHKKTLRFTGPKTVKKGAKLEILNTLSPAGDGPHTFTLVQSALTKKEGKQCASDAGSDLCNALIVAHKVKFLSKDQIKVRKPVVDNGKKGWDTPFSSDGKTAGDSWYTDQKNETASRKVTAPVGTKLHYFCVVHPFMQGTIKVVK